MKGNGGIRDEMGVQKAVASLASKRGEKHVHSNRCMALIRNIITSDEETILECKQSLFRNISPARVILTTKRMIIVRPSFWGLYLRHDLVTPTEYSIIPYRQLISVILTRGKLLSTIHMRIHGFVDSSTDVRNEGEIHGIRTEKAIKLANFLEEVIEYQENNEDEYDDYELYKKNGKKENREEIKSLNLEEARSLVLKSDSKFIWLGAEPLDYVTAILGIDRDKVITVNTGSIANVNDEERNRLENCIFVGYNEEAPGHYAHLLKKARNINTYILKGGIRGVAHEYFRQNGNYYTS